MPTKYLGFVSGALALCFAGSVAAAPVSYSFTGSLHPSLVIANGTLTGLFAVNDAFTLTASVNQDGAPDITSSSPNIHEQRWDSGNTISLSINGQTFSVFDGTGDYSRAISYSGLPGNSDFLEQVGASNTNTAFNSPGSATSSLAGVDHVFLHWAMYNGNVGNPVLSFSDPRFPASLDLSDFQDILLSFAVYDYDSNGAQIGYAEYWYFGPNGFSGVTSGGGGGGGVPAPGALALLGFGLISAAFFRRR